MAGTLLAAFAIAAAAAAADEAGALPPSGLRLEQGLVAPAAAEPVDPRNFKQRRRAARARALSWLSAPLDDHELALAVAAGRTPGAVRPRESVTGDGAELVWNRPSLLTLGRVPGQPGAAGWQRWQDAVLRARARREAVEDGAAADAP